MKKQIIASNIKVTTFSNEEALLKRVNPDLYRIYKAIKIIQDFGGNGSFEVHFVKGRIRSKNGLYMKPSFDMIK